MIKFRILENEANVSSNNNDSQFRSVLEYREILKNYLTDKFTKIFNKVFQHQLKSNFVVREELIKFYICYIALCYSNITNVHHPFATSELYNILTNKRITTLLTEHHEFTHNDFFQLITGKHNWENFINSNNNEEIKKIITTNNSIGNLSIIVPWWDHTEFLELWENNLKYQP